MNDTDIPLQPLMPGLETDTCGYCGQQGHWLPDCNLKAKHESDASWHDFYEPEEVRSARGGAGWIEPYDD